MGFYANGASQRSVLRSKTVAMRSWAVGHSPLLITWIIHHNGSRCCLAVNTLWRRIMVCLITKTSLSKAMPWTIAELVYGKAPVSGNRDESFELPDYSVVHSQLTTRKNMTLIYQWNRYKKKCEADTLKHYSYREWNAGYFIRMAMTVGNSTVSVIKSILSSWKLEVQTLPVSSHSRI